jgi:hypothetical protein
MTSSSSFLSSSTSTTSTSSSLPVATTPPDKAPGTPSEEEIVKVCTRSESMYCEIVVANLQPVQRVMQHIIDRESKHPIGTISSISVMSSL